MKHTAILAKKYNEVVDALVANKAIKDMAKEIGKSRFKKNLGSDGTPSLEFMLSANDEFSKRSPRCKLDLHIGAVAEALMKLLIGKPTKTKQGKKDK